MTKRGTSVRFGVSAALFAIGVAMTAAACGVGGIGLASDGERCAADDECESGYCPGSVAYGKPSGRDSYCAGLSGCSDDGDCEDGWRCLTFTSLTDDIANAFGGDEESSICKPTCGHCPPDHHCVEGQESDLCEQGSLLIVSAGGPYEALVGEPVQLSATAEGSSRIVSYTWTIGAGEGEPLSGAQVTHVFEQAGRTTVSVTVVDGTEHEVEELAEVDVRVGQGGVCVSYECAPGLSCVSGLCQ
jgi:hypothetical protein